MHACTVRVRLARPTVVLVEPCSNRERLNLVSLRFLPVVFSFFLCCAKQCCTRECFRGGSFVYYYYVLLVAYRQYVAASSICLYVPRYRYSKAFIQRSNNPNKPNFRKEPTRREADRECCCAVRTAYESGYIVVDSPALLLACILTSSV